MEKNELIQFWKHFGQSQRKGKKDIFVFSGYYFINIITMVNKSLSKLNKYIFFKFYRVGFLRFFIFISIKNVQIIMYLKNKGFNENGIRKRKTIIVFDQLLFQYSKNNKFESFNSLKN